MSRKFSNIILLTFLLLIFLGLTLLAFTNRTSIFGLASQVRIDSEISYDNSYIFASPLSANTAYKEKIRVTVILLNSKGLGVSSKQVKLKTDPGIIVSSIQDVTDSYGKAVFDISAVSPGEYLITAQVSNISISQTVKVSFE